MVNTAERVRQGKERRARFLRAFEKGRTPRQLATQHDISTQRVYIILQKAREEREARP